MPITENSKQKERETIIAIAKNNEFPISILTDLKTKIIKRKKTKTKTSPHTTTRRNNNTAM
jgi:ethanolamine utilization protein EutQ (cupin superfamily)